MTTFIFDQYKYQGHGIWISDHAEIHKVGKEFKVYKDGMEPFTRPTFEEACLSGGVTA